MTAPALPTYDDVVAAAGRLQGRAHRTPVLTSRTADEELGARDAPAAKVAEPACKRYQR